MTIRKTALVNSVTTAIKIVGSVMIAMGSTQWVVHSGYLGGNDW